MSQHARNPRFLFIDGLRGVAAGAVLLFHLGTSDFFHHSPGVLQPLNDLAVRYGFLGVEIFFVISGFVIAYSLRNARITGGYTLNFIVRRSLRLDPPYWASIVATVLVSALLTLFFHATTFGMPSASTLLAHVFYLQGIFGRPQILIVFWTLCYEIQFYLLYMVLQFFAQRMTRTPHKAGAVLNGLLVLTGSASLVTFMVNSSAGPWCYNWWFLFALGALIAREMLSGRILFSLVGALLVLASGIGAHHAEPAAGALTALALITAVNRDGLCAWLSNSPIQYLGRISYSLYLTHAMVLHIVGSIFARYYIFTLFYSIPAYILMLGIPIVAAEVFYRMIEKPSHRWAIRFGRANTQRIADTLAHVDDGYVGEATFFPGPAQNV